MNIDIYLSNYDNLEKKIVYDFSAGSGGLADYIKFSTYLLNLCIKYNIRMYFMLENNLIDNFIKLAYNKMYIRRNELTNPRNINNINDLINIEANIFNIIGSCPMYNIPNSELYGSISYLANKIFYFTNEIKTNAVSLPFSDKKYISIHLRL